MKPIHWILIIVGVIVLLYFLGRTKVKAPVSVNTPSGPVKNPYLAGLNLLNTIHNTNCGKYGNPPCTIKDLQDAGWSPDQIAEAQAASQTTEVTVQCLYLGIGC